MSAGKSANNAVNAWKAKMRAIIKDIPACAQLRVHDFNLVVNRRWADGWVRYTTPPPITVRLHKHLRHDGLISIMEYDSTYHQWLISLSPLTNNDAVKYVRDYYTGGRRAIGEME